MDMKIRREQPKDYREVENLTREAFWNLYVPGCDEHYLVHIMRDHDDFIPELAFVAEVDNTIVGSIMYTRSWLADETGRRIETLTFGPVCVLPGYQRQGIGSALIQHSFDMIRSRPEQLVVIQGHPGNYVRHGFKNGKDHGVSDAEGKYPFGQLVCELEPGALAGHQWVVQLSNVFEMDSEAAEAFDSSFPPKEKGYSHTQEEFSIAVRAYLD